MRIKELIDLLKLFPADSEIRVATSLDDPACGGNSHDLPLVGATTEFTPANLGGVLTPPNQNTVWLATSFYLEPLPAPRTGKTTRED